MLYLILGLVLFLGVHSFSMFRGYREAVIGRLGMGYYKVSYTAKAAIGLALIIYGFHRYRQAGEIVVWTPPFWLHYVTLAFMWCALVALFAVNKTPGRIAGWLHHPMVTAVKFWALAHLLSNGDLGGMILFGSFLAWAVIDRISLKKRGDLGAASQPKFTQADGQAVALGSAIFLVIIFLHPYLFGVSAFTW